jgi:phosphoglycerol geranylgeranyltransferase
VKGQQAIYSLINARQGQVAVLIDPEKCDNGPGLLELLKKAEFAGVDYLFIGGSTVTKSEFEATVLFVKENSLLPLVIFPGSSHQVSANADALLYLSLISGRNPDYLIGHHVQSASEILALDLETIPTGYLLIDGGTKSSVAYVSQTTPIPRDQFTIARNTAIAGVLQGKKLLYFDAGSGAQFPVPIEMIREVATLNVPIIVGGGIRTVDQMNLLKSVGVHVIVIGNHLEDNLDFMLDIRSFLKSGSTESREENRRL